MHTHTLGEKEIDNSQALEKRERERRSERKRESVCVFLRERKRGERVCLSINWAKITDKYRGHPF